MTLKTWSCWNCSPPPPHSLPKTTWCLFIVISFSTELNKSPLSNDTEQNINTHTYTLERYTRIDREKTPFIDVCISITHLNTKKYIQTATGAGEEKRTMKHVARTAELIDSVDNNKRNDWNQSVPNNNNNSKKSKEFTERKRKEKERWQPKIPMSGPNIAATSTDCIQ